VSSSVVPHAPPGPEAAPSHSATPSDKPSRLRALFRSHLGLILALLAATALRLLYIDAPLLDAHRWRQVDTAFMARAFYESGINPLKPEAVWGGAHGYVESEFPLLPAIVAVLFKLFGPDETWGRLVVAVFSVATVGLTYELGRLLGGRALGLAAATLTAFSPSAVFYGRAVMPDTLMLFFSLAAVIGFLRHEESGSGRALAWGSASLAFAILVKLPGVLVLAPIAWICWSSRRWRLLQDRRLLAAVIVPCVVGLGWYAYAYSIYLDTGLTFGVVGTTKTYPADVGPGPWPTAFSKWSTVELLTSRRFYETLFTRLYFLHLTPPGFALALLGILLMRRLRRVRVLDAWLVAVVAFILAAGEGHMGHDYYQLPLVPILALYFGAAAWPVFDAGWVARTIRPGPAARIAVGALVAILGGFCFWQSGVIDRHFRPETLDARLRRAGQEIDAATDDNSLMVVVDDYGVNSPMLLYFAHARGWSLDPDTASAEVVSNLQSAKSARYFATTRMPDVRRRQPDLALFLDTRKPIPLNDAPPGTALFDLRARR
jgi:4-amino-4-deoxy-L-arabinose transferase-like glycosyltransferase